MVTPSQGCLGLWQMEQTKGGIYSLHPEHTACCACPIGQGSLHQKMTASGGMDSLQVALFHLTGVLKQSFWAKLCKKPQALLSCWGLALCFAKWFKVAEIHERHHHTAYLNEVTTLTPSHFQQSWFCLLLGRRAALAFRWKMVVNWIQPFAKLP